jgi:hypothetical protein
LGFFFFCREEVGESVDCQLSRIDFKRFCQDSDSDQDTTPKRRFHSVFFEDLGRVETPIFDLEQFGVGDYVVGPAVLLHRFEFLFLSSILLGLPELFFLVC